MLIAKTIDVLQSRSLLSCTDPIRSFLLNNSANGVIGDEKGKGKMFPSSLNGQTIVFEQVASLLRLSSSSSSSSLSADVEHVRVDRATFFSLFSVHASSLVRLDLTRSTASSFHSPSLSSATDLLQERSTIFASTGWTLLKKYSPYGQVAIGSDERTRAVQLPSHPSFARLFFSCRIDRKCRRGGRGTNDPLRSTDVKRRERVATSPTKHFSGESLRPSKWTGERRKGGESFRHSSLPIQGLRANRSGNRRSMGSGMNEGMNE